MAIPKLAPDFKEFLKLLESNHVEYLLIGGYAVGIYGYVRATNDLDIWVRMSVNNAASLVRALKDFGFAAAVAETFLVASNVIRMGVPPIRIKILTTISGADFDTCFAERCLIDVDGIEVPVISLARLRQNKVAAGRAKDLADLESLPEG